MEKLLYLCHPHTAGDRLGQAGDPGVAEDGFPVDQLVKGWAGRGDMRCITETPQNPTKMHSASHRAAEPRVRGGTEVSPWGTGQG